MCAFKGLLLITCGLYVEQVLEEEEYEVWLKRQLLAESSIENREVLMLESAQRLETNLTLLGRRAIQCSLYMDPHRAVVV